MFGHTTTLSPVTAKGGMVSTALHACEFASLAQGTPKMLTVQNSYC